MKILDIPGNIGALKYWLTQFANVEMIKPDDIPFLESGEILVLPGGNVGGFSRKTSQDICLSIKKRCRILAVCGSFQSLFSGTDEDHNQFCLQLFSGYTKKLISPRIGPFRVESYWFKGSPYFNHSYAVTTTKKNRNSDHLAVDEFGICWAVRTKQVLGVQFHPELSQNKFDMAFTKWLLDE